MKYLLNEESYLTYQSLSLPKCAVRNMIPSSPNADSSVHLYHTLPQSPPCSHMCTNMHFYMHAHTHIHMHTQTHALTHAHVHTYTPIHSATHIYMCTHTKQSQEPWLLSPDVSCMAFCSRDSPTWAIAERLPAYQPLPQLPPALLPHQAQA